MNAVDSGTPNSQWLGLLGQYDPSLSAAFTRYWARLSSHKELSGKDDGLLAFAVCIAAASDYPFTQEGLDSAIADGATVDETMGVALAVRIVLGSVALRRCLIAIDYAKARARATWDIPDAHSRRQRGHDKVPNSQPPWMGLLRDWSPEVWEEWSAWRSVAFGRANLLSEKMFAFVIFAVDTAIGYPSHPFVDIAITADARRQEVLDVIAVCGRLLRPHALCTGIDTLSLRQPGLTRSRVTISDAKKGH